MDLAHLFRYFVPQPRPLSTPVTSCRCGARWCCMWVVGDSDTDGRGEGLAPIIEQKCCCFGANSTVELSPGSSTPQRWPMDGALLGLPVLVPGGLRDVRPRRCPRPYMLSAGVDLFDNRCCGWFYVQQEGSPGPAGHEARPIQRLWCRSCGKSRCMRPRPCRRTCFWTPLPPSSPNIPTRLSSAFNTHAHTPPRPPVTNARLTPPHHAHVCAFSSTRFYPSTVCVVG